MKNKKMNFLNPILLSVLMVSLVGTVGCSKPKESPVQPAQKEAPAAATTAATTAPVVASGNVLARLNGQPITDDDVRKVAGTKLSQAELELYDARKDGLDQIIEDKLLTAEASKQGMSKQDLLKKNITDKIKVEDKDVEKFYKEKQAQMQGKKLEEVKDSIRNMLNREKYQGLYGDLLDKLRNKADLEVMIKAPKVEVDEGEGSPAIGPKDAPVKIVEFTDYQCPFCGRARPTVNQILDTYKGKVRYVLRDFPLSFHKDSFKAHEASHCAADQGKYWELNKKFFENQKEIKIEDIKKHATDLKLNMTTFNQCLDSGKYASKVSADQQYGESVGVSGTPAFFINGRMLSGARPFASFKEIIDDELREAKRN